MPTFAPKLPCPPIFHDTQKLRSFLIAKSKFLNQKPKTKNQKPKTKNQKTKKIKWSMPRKLPIYHPSLRTEEESAQRIFSNTTEVVQCSLLFLVSKEAAPLDQLEVSLVYIEKVTYKSLSSLLFIITIKCLIDLLLLILLFNFIFFCNLIFFFFSKK